MANDFNDILSREEIEEQLKKIAKNYNYKGEILNILIKLMSECAYLTTLNSASILMEGSLLTANKFNSMLALCHDNMAPVNRGYCQRILVDNLYVTQNKSVKRFELLESKSSQYKLYFAEDASYDTNSGVVALTLLVGSDIISYENTEEVDNRLSSNLYYLDIPTTYLSEDIILYKNDREIYNVDSIQISEQANEKYRGYMFTTNPKLVSEIVPYYICTVPPDYSVRIYNYNRFLISDKYTFKCIKKVDNNIADMSTSLINNLQGFVFKDNTPMISSTPSIPAEQSISFLKSKIIYNFRDRNYISSYNAILNAIESKLSKYFLGFTINITNGKILLIFSLKDGVSWGTAIEKEFIDSMIFDYKIEEKFVFEQAKDKEVPLYINIYYSNLINELEIKEKINEFEKQVGGEYLLDALKGVIDKQQNVLYTEVIPEYADIMNASGTKVSLSAEENMIDTDGRPMLNADGSNIKKNVIYRLRFNPKDIRFISKTETI